MLLAPMLVLLGTADLQDYKCNYAKVAKGQSAPIYAGNGPQRRTKATLKPGTVVYVCDESAADYDVRFSGRRHRCPIFLQSGVNVQEARRCERGWVAKRMIVVLSG